MQNAAKESLSVIKNAEEMSSKNEEGLKAVLLSDQSTNFIPPDELLENMLTVGDSSVIYGDSNSGKTFLAIDIACAIARGTKWMGRCTEPGMVVYLAAESPGSVLRRLQAYQKYHNVIVPNFVIVQSPVDLFNGDADTHAVIKLVKKFENQLGKKAQLIVGDTLARLMTGGNESASLDMGIVVKHMDFIRAHTGAHFNFIHHSGKQALAGARGSNSLRCAIDTEIEITDSPDGRCAEIRKQRDLGSKGERIGFRLETLNMGMTKWNKPATSCVVLPWDAPPKKIGKKPNQAKLAVEEYVLNNSNPLSRAGLVRHFDGRCGSSAVYYAINELIADGKADCVMGYIVKKDQK